jgi:hypothetical protein
MLNADQTAELARTLGLKVPSGKRAEQCRALAESIPFATLHDFCLSRWTRPNAAVHIQNLKSGKLTGFSWHDLAPSRMHLGLQGHVRRVAAGEITLDDFLELGADVIRKEYVMVAIADLTEVTLVERCGATPPIRAKSVADVIIRGLPFDVKNGSIPNGWTATAIRKDPAKFAAAMIAGADSERIRKEASTAYNAWANNRIFVNTEREERWLSEPERVLDELAAAAAALKDPYEIVVDGNPVLVHVIVL